MNQRIKNEKSHFTSLQFTYESKGFLAATTFTTIVQCTEKLLYSNSL